MGTMRAVQQKKAGHKSASESGLLTQWQRLNLLDDASAARYKAAHAGKDINFKMPAHEVRAAVIDFLEERHPEIDDSTRRQIRLMSLIADIVNEWEIAQKSYAWITSRGKRKHLIEAIDVTMRATWELFALINYDGRFSIDEMSLANLHNWIKEIVPPDGGRPPEIPAAACAKQLGRLFTQVSGNPCWNFVGKIILQRFPTVSLLVNSEKTLSGRARKLANRSDAWWQKFRQRTFSLNHKFDDIGPGVKRDFKELLAREKRRAELNQKRQTPLKTTRRDHHENLAEARGRGD